MALRLANVFRLGIKELYSLRADPILLVMIVYAFTFAVYAQATGAKTEVENVAVGIVDEDDSELSRRIAGAILEPQFKPAVQLTPNEIDPGMNSGRFVFVLEIPPKFESDVLAGRRPTVQIDVDATALSQAGIGASYLQNIIEQEASGYLQHREGAISLPINLVIRTAFNPNHNSEWFLGDHGGDQQHYDADRRSDGGGAHSRTRTRNRRASAGDAGQTGRNHDREDLGQRSRDRAWSPSCRCGSLSTACCGCRSPDRCRCSWPVRSFTKSRSRLSAFCSQPSPARWVSSVCSWSRCWLSSTCCRAARRRRKACRTWLIEVMKVTPTPHFVSFAQAVLYRAAGLDIVWPQLAALAAITPVFFGVSLMRFRTTIASFG